MKNIAEEKKQLVIYFNMHRGAGVHQHCIGNMGSGKNDVQEDTKKKRSADIARARATRMQKDGNQNFLIMHLSAQANNEQHKKKREKNTTREEREAPDKTN